VDSTFDVRNKYSQEVLLIRIGLLMYLIILVQAIKLFFVNTPHWHYHLINVLLHGVCLLACVLYLKFYLATWSKFAVFICFASYLLVACHLWQADPSISYFILVELFIASLVFPNRENAAFIILVAILLSIYFYIQLNFSAVSTNHGIDIHRVKQLNQVTLAFACVTCAFYLRSMISTNWKRVKRANRTGQEIIDSLIPRPFQPSLISTKESVSEQTYKTDECVIISIDFVNSSQIMRDIGDLKAQQAFNHIFRLIDDLVTKKNAFRIKTNGDQYLIAVGYSHTGNATVIDINASVYVAIELAIEANNLVQGAAKHNNLEIKIGIATGQVYSGLGSNTHPSHDIWGETMVRCTRLESIASAGEVVIDEMTYRACSYDLSIVFCHQHRLLKGIGKTSLYRVNAKELQKTIEKNTGRRSV